MKTEVVLKSPDLTDADDEDDGLMKTEVVLKFVFIKFTNKFIQFNENRSCIEICLLRM